MARMVPVGMDFCASRRSPERLEPAMMPGERGRCQGWELHRRVSRPAARPLGGVPGHGAGTRLHRSRLPRPTSIFPPDPWSEATEGLGTKPIYVTCLISP